MHIVLSVIYSLIQNTFFHFSFPCISNFNLAHYFAHAAIKYAIPVSTLTQKALINQPLYFTTYLS